MPIRLFLFFFLCSLSKWASLPASEAALFWLSPIFTHLNTVQHWPLNAHHGASHLWEYIKKKQKKKPLIHSNEWVWGWNHLQPITLSPLIHLKTALWGTDSLVLEPSNLNGLMWKNVNFHNVNVNFHNDTIPLCKLVPPPHTHLSQEPMTSYKA